MPYKDKATQLAYQNEWMKKRRKAWLDANGPCKHCGATENLEVDHIDPRDKITHRIWSYSQAKRDLELAKCQVLCEKCHMAKSLANGDIPVPPMVHGSETRWRKGCRCDPCCAGHQHYLDTEYRKRNNRMPKDIAAA